MLGRKTVKESMLKLMSIESVIPSNHLILCHPLLLLPSASLAQSEAGPVKLGCTALL